MKKIIAFSLWGSNSQYTIGAINNADLARIIYPGWLCRFYQDTTVPEEIVHDLGKRENVELIKRSAENDWQRLFWLFDAAADDSVEIMIARDTDSRLHEREKAAVDEWLASDKLFHIMRDHPYHYFPIMTGMWGVKGDLLKSIKDWIHEYLEQQDVNIIQPRQHIDREFLTEIVYPKVINKSLVHDDFFSLNPFPTPRKNSEEYVGRVFEIEYNSGDKENDQLLKKALEQPQDTTIQAILARTKEIYAILILQITHKILSTGKYDIAHEQIKEALRCSQSDKVKEALVALFLSSSNKFIFDAPPLPNLNEITKHITFSAPDAAQKNDVQAKGFGKYSSSKGKKKKVKEKAQKVSKLFASAVYFHQKEQLEKALPIYREILTLERKHSDTLVNMGAILRRLGQIKEAITCYRRFLKLNPKIGEIWCNLGNALESIGNIEEAKSAFLKAIALKPNLGVAHFHLGQILHNQENWQEAEKYYRQTLKLNPQFVMAYNNLGNVLGAQGKIQEAISQYQQSIKLQPDYAEAHYNLGNALREQKNYEPAKTSYQLAINYQPDLVPAYFNLGITLEALEQLPEAEEAFKQALVQEPKLSEAHMHLAKLAKERKDLATEEKHLRMALNLRKNDGIAHTLLINLVAQGKSQEAISLVEEKIAQFPEDAESFYNLGTLYNQLGQYEKALTYLHKALELDPKLTMAYQNLAFAYSQQSQFTEVIRAQQKAIEVDPKMVVPHLNLGYSYYNQGHILKAIDCFRETLRLDPNFHPGHSGLLHTLNFDPNSTPEAIAQAHTEWGKQYSIPVKQYPNPREPQRPLKIGYVSPDFRQHSVSYFLKPILEHHSPEQFTVFAYANVVKPDEVTERLRAIVPHWRDISQENDAAVCEQILHDEIDILIDLAGHTGNNRLPVFAQKPAPIQISYLKYPNTTGLAAMNYRLTDSWADSPGTEQYYTEELIRLPQCFLSYQPPKDAPPVIELPALTHSGITLGSFKALVTLTPEVIAMWSKILLALPNSRILLQSPFFDDRTICKPYLFQFAQHGINQQRICLLGGRKNPRERLEFYSNIDICLDTSPYNDILSSCEALWMGVPVISLIGKTHGSRVGYSLLNGVGLPELATNSWQEYIDKAIALASDLDGLAQMRSTLRQKMASSILCDGETFTRNLEATYRALWEQECSNC